MLRDLDIRNALRDGLASEFRRDPSTVIVDELGILGGATRADVAVVNGKMGAYEIKSARDTLERLPRQIELYSLVFDYITLVVSDVHVDAIDKLVPKSWGITVATLDKEGNVELSPLRQSSHNPNVDARAVVELLWRAEALQFLEEIGAERGVKSKARAVIWDRVCEVYSLDAIRERVRLCLKRRKGPEYSRQ